MLDGILCLFLFSSFTARSDSLDTFLHTFLVVDKLNEIGMTVRNNKRPFGGIQVRTRVSFSPSSPFEADGTFSCLLQIVACGDYLQLPPVSDKGSKATFAFQAKSWAAAIPRVVVLKHVFRQKDDRESVPFLSKCCLSLTYVCSRIGFTGFVTILSELVRTETDASKLSFSDPPFLLLQTDQMRIGAMDDHTVASLTALSRSIVWEDGIYSELFVFSFRASLLCLSLSLSIDEFLPPRILATP